MSLLQGVFRSKTEVIEKSLNIIRLDGKQRTPYEDKHDSDDDLVDVDSLPETPSRTRPSSPAGSRTSSRLAKRLHIISSNRLDPLKAFPAELSQQIFSRLSTRDLAICALVCKKWARSQSLNYVWFQHYRKENFHDESLPPGKWSKRESKQNWRQVYHRSIKERSPSSTIFSHSGSGYTSPVGNRSGYQTPREIKEEQWKLESEAISQPGKLEMREMYKELGGRKARSKTKLGSTGIRDKGGWNDGGEAW